MRALTRIELMPYSKTLRDPKGYEDYQEKKVANNVSVIKILAETSKKLDLFKKNNFVINFLGDKLVLRSVLEARSVITFKGGRTYIDYDFNAISRILGNSPKVIFDILHVKKAANIFQKIGAAYIHCYFSRNVVDGRIKVYFIGQTDKMRITLHKYCWIPFEEPTQVVTDNQSYSQPVPVKEREPGTLYSENAMVSHSMRMMPHEQSLRGVSHNQAIFKPSVQTPFIKAEHDNFGQMGKRINTGKSSSMRISDSGLSGVPNQLGDPFSIDTSEQIRLGLRKEHGSFKEMPSIDLISQSIKKEPNNFSGKFNGKPSQQMKPESSKQGTFNYFTNKKKSLKNEFEKKEEVEQMFDFLDDHENPGIPTIKEESSQIDFMIHMDDNQNQANETFIKKEDMLNSFDHLRKKATTIAKNDVLKVKEMLMMSDGSDSD